LPIKPRTKYNEQQQQQINRQKNHLHNVKTMHMYNVYVTDNCAITM